MTDVAEKILKARIKNVVHLIRLSPEKDQDEMVERFTKGESENFVKLVRDELNRFEMEVIKEIRSESVTGGQDDHLKCIVVDNNDKDAIYVKIFSFDPTKKHEIFNKMIGKKLKVIIREIKS